MSDSDDEQERKRPKTSTDLIIEAALNEEARAKKAKKGITDDGPVKVVKKKDGKTLAEIEEEEGGPVRESLVGIAMVKRAATRKKGDTDQQLDESTDVPDVVDGFEEKAEVEEEDGQKFTGFNLDEERETGFFDEEGNFVERKEDVDPTEQDAWMTSDDAKVVSEAVRQKIEARRKLEEAEANVRVAPLTDRQIAAFKSEMAGHMQPKETLAKALKRLGAGQQAQRAMGKRQKQRQQQQQQQQQQDGASTSAAAGADAAVIFARMTELADQLLVEGEVDVYDSTREEFERFAAMWAPKPQQPAAAGTGPGAQAAPPQDDDEDMFAADDDGDDKKSAGGNGMATAGAVNTDAAAAAASKAGPSGPSDKAGQQGEGTAAAAVAGGQGTGSAAGGKEALGATAASVSQPVLAAAAAGGGGGGAEDTVDYSTWPIKELKRFLKERGVDAESFVEKGDMVKRVVELAAAGPSTAQGTGAPQAAHPVPLGYAFDPQSGYYHNVEVGMYFDASSGYYWSQGSWYTLDPHTQGFVPMQV